MAKVAIVGANGQVGAEVCLLLRVNAPALDLVPICRNRAGSAFLRWHGIPCRHGSVADPVAARRLVGDCDVIVNLALAGGTPRQISTAERMIIENSIASAAPKATLLYFSTIMVYGDRRSGRRFRMRDAYGATKRRSERICRRAASRGGNPLYVLRLGHVCGEVQNISRAIRRELAEGRAVLPRPSQPSNTVYTVTIVDAIQSILGGREQPGTYDLLNNPQFSWGEVYQWEGKQCGVSFDVSATANEIAAPAHYRFRAVRRLGMRLATIPLLRKGGGALFSRAPDFLNNRAWARWNLARARREIAALRNVGTAPEHLTWLATGERFLQSLRPTAELLERASQLENDNNIASSAWPADLPYAIEVRSARPTRFG